MPTGAAASLSKPLIFLRSSRVPTNCAQPIALRVCDSTCRETPNVRMPRADGRNSEKRCRRNPVLTLDEPLGATYVLAALPVDIALRCGARLQVRKAELLYYL